MGTRIVWLDEEAEKTLTRLRHLTGLFISDGGFSAHRIQRGHHFDAFQIVA